MAFGQISRALAIPAGATADYTFFAFHLTVAGPPTLTCRHVGDGTPAFKRASWRYANSTRAARAGLGNTISEARTKQALYDEARMIADHCVAGWRNVVEEGATEPAPCTPDKVHEFLCAVIDAPEGIYAYKAFRDWAAEPTNFRPAQDTDAVELGKP